MTKSETDVHIIFLYAFKITREMWMQCRQVHTDRRWANVNLIYWPEDTTFGWNPVCPTKCRATQQIYRTPNSAKRKCWTLTTKLQAIYRIQVRWRLWLTWATGQRHQPSSTGAHTFHTPISWTTRKCIQNVLCCQPRTKKRQTTNKKQLDRPNRTLGSNRWIYRMHRQREMDSV